MDDWQWITVVHDGGNWRAIRQSGEGAMENELPYGLAAYKCEGEPVVEADELIHVASYPPVPKIKPRPTYMEIMADPSKHDFNEENLATMLNGMIEAAEEHQKPSLRMTATEVRHRLANQMQPSERARYQASLKHKDEIIAGLRAENERMLQSIWDVADFDAIAIKREAELVRERDRLIGEKAAFEAASKHWREIADERLSQAQAAHGEIQALKQRVKELESRPDSGLGVALYSQSHEAAAGAKIARALANSGESHRHDGLKLFDHYY